MPSPQRAPGTHPRRRRRQVDWELIACGVSGHHLVGTDAAELRAADAVFAREHEGLRWHRCLRCDSWVVLTRPEPPATEHPPERHEIEVPLRGRALRDKVVLRLIAVDRALHFTILVLLGTAVLIFAVHESSLRASYYRILADIQRGVGGGPIQNDAHAGLLHELNKLFSLRRGTLRGVGLALLAYGILEGVEAVGLWLAKRWAEYLTFVATTILLPFEIYELAHRATALKIVGFIINVAVVIYLLFAKRLFGLRGGGAAEQREREADGGWPAIERATPPPALVPSSAGGPGST